MATIAEVHDHLWRGSRIGFVDLADFMGELCKKLQGNTDRHTLHCHADPMLISADHAIPLGLLINELVSLIARRKGASWLQVASRLERFEKSAIIIEQFSHFIENFRSCLKRGIDGVGLRGG